MDLSDSPLWLCFLDDVLEEDTQLQDWIQMANARWFMFCQEALNAAVRKKGNKRIIFVSASFEGERFKKTKVVSRQILGPPALIQFLSRIPRTIPILRRPTYSNSMAEVVAVVDGFGDRQNSQIIRQIQNMGGKVVKRLNASSAAKYHPSHLIAYSALSKSYDLACSLGITVATEEWPRAVWRRKEENLHSVDVIEPFLLHAAAFFRRIHFHLIGFGSTERIHFTDSIAAVGGTVDRHISTSTNVVVVNEFSSTLSVQLLLNETAEKRTIRISLKEELYVCDLDHEQSVVDSQFLIQCFSNQSCLPVDKFSIFRDETVCTGSGRKRRLSSVEASDPETFTSPKRRLHRSIMTPCSGATPSRQLRTLALSSPSQRPLQQRQCVAVQEDLQESDDVSALKRRYRVIELLDTEQNYLKILRSILDNIVRPLERSSSDEPAFLDAEQLKAVFGLLPELCRIHEEIFMELRAVMNEDDPCGVGVIFSKRAGSICTTYSSFINSYEASKRLIVDTMAQKPKFHQFLKRCLALQEFGRQSLPDLLMRPVQRLPSVLLLLKDLYKHTLETHSDYGRLQEAVAELERVLIFINESKRITDLRLDSLDGGKLEDGAVDATTRRPWEKARKLASRTSLCVSKVFSLGGRTGSGLKRAASTMLCTPAKNAKNTPEPTEVYRSLGN